MHVTRLIAALLALLLPAAPGQATMRAVLIGVSEFADPRLSAHALPGAAQDVRRMGEALASLGVDPQATVTLSGRDATLPAIRAALDRLAVQSSAGDRAIIFLSGHGTQAPVPAPDPIEPDGLDELFLAADAGPWDARSRIVPGALVDNEIGRRVGELRVRGVDVWLVIDSCTGGGLLRSGAAGARAKSIAPQSLGIPAAPPMRGAIDASGFVDGGLAAGGRLVAYAAAGPGAIAWDDGDGGAFTTALAAVLSAEKPASFAALAARTRAGIRNAASGGALAAPIWTAGDLSAPILFDGRSPDLLELARTLPALPLTTRLTVDAAGACRRSGPLPKGKALTADIIALRQCDHVRIDMIEPPAPLRIEAWYRDAGGATTSLAPPLGLPVTPGRWANVGFTFVTHDPATGRALPRGTETLVLIARDETGAALGARIFDFRAVE